MKVEKFGEGEPEISVVAGIHGDEPRGVNAVEYVLEKNLDYKKPVQFIIANEKAFRQSKRYIETDLNRAFPGDPDSETYEERLAHTLLQVTEGTRTIDLHSTRSQKEVFALNGRLDEVEPEDLMDLGIREYVLTDEAYSTSLVSYLDYAFSVECGLTGADETESNAYKIIMEFLKIQGAIDDVKEYRADTDYLDIYEIYEEIEKPEPVDLSVENFEEVAEGEVVASFEDRDILAKEPFYPVLCSETGYKTRIGYKAKKSRTIRDE